jgi:DNA-binding response OmpR family regulator
MSATRRLLFVEDDPDIATVLRLAFDPREYQSDWVTTLAAARERLVHRPPDAVVLDLGLPDGDGLDLCCEIKATWPALPVVIVTASGAGNARYQALACGADGFLPKPFDPDTLEAEIARLTAPSGTVAPSRNTPTAPTAPRLRRP